MNLQPADFITLVSNLTTASWVDDDDGHDDDVKNDDYCDKENANDGANDAISPYPSNQLLKAVAEPKTTGNVPNRLVIVFSWFASLTDSQD